ncbi:Heat stress transcription factor A-3 [Sesamum angolense]|uniref:Heat stress transcription factor A-3 n=1 Tax=Sesamum angolense TaxID=2727404 RepID=A0AAE1WMW8_9LAMI|nr:Heat stress transcription factor A-3 [Sesamum angolense]
MDPDGFQHLPGTTTFPPPQSFPLPLSMASPFEFKAGVAGSRAAGEESLSGVPKPLDFLHENPIPPFLSKTYDLVDDPSLDSIISWGERGDSFVVWDPVEFARTILPRNFKHNNFSSFVRQLNTYNSAEFLNLLYNFLRWTDEIGMCIRSQGFRKIDADKWEFTNEGFVKGQRHLLKKIQRRKSHQSQQIGSSCGSPSEAGKVALGGEIERLREERSFMMQELVELHQQQRGTVQRMEIVKEKLEEAEKRQKLMVSFLAKMFKNPAILARLQETREQKSITSPRSMRKFVKHQAQEPSTLSSQLEPYSSAFPSAIPDSVPPALKQLPVISSQNIGDSPLFGAVNVASQVEDELAMVHEFLRTQEQAQSMDPVLTGKSSTTTQPQSRNEYFVSFPEDFLMENSFPEFSIAGNGNTAMEDVWNTGFGPGAGISGSTTKLWSNLGNYDVPELGIDGGLSDICGIGSLQQAGSSGIGGWMDDDSP